MKRTILRHNRTAAIALLATVFLVGCSKNKDVAYPGNPGQSQQKTVIAFNEGAGDLMKYDSKGRIIEQYMNQTYRTYYEYPYANEVLIKVVDLTIDKMMGQFVVQLENGRAVEMNGAYYNQNGVLVKNFGSQFEYNASGYLTKITNDNGFNSDVVFTYDGDLVTEVKKGNEKAVFEYDMTTKLPVPVPNHVYGLLYQNFYQLSGLFYNGMMGKSSFYAVKKIDKPSIWQYPAVFINSYGKSGELLGSKLSTPDQSFLGLEMKLTYQDISIQP